MDSEGAPSRTAMMAACSRGWHLFTHGPHAIFDDWLAWPLVGQEAESLVGRLIPIFGDATPAIANWMATRQRTAEDWLANSDARQYVVLGAGLDSYAWRVDDGVRVFEVDHPSTQTWKQSRLGALHLDAPEHLTWVPVDFETESFADRLKDSGLEFGSTFVSWLGVTPYLTLETIGTALDELPPCSLAVSYATPEELWSEECLRISSIFRAITADSGEPILTLLTPEDFAGLLADHGFVVTDDVGDVDVKQRFGLPGLANVGERLTLATKTT